MPESTAEKPRLPDGMPSDLLSEISSVPCVAEN
jgi:hypothetical protein